MRWQLFYHIVEEVENFMAMQPKIRTVMSRRGVFHAAGAAVLSLVALAAGAGAAIAKMTQKAAGYQDKSKDGQECSGCALFKSPDSCSLVDGSINPEGWCRFYSKKS